MWGEFQYTLLGTKNTQHIVGKNRPKCFGQYAEGTGSLHLMTEKLKET